ncbi:MAG: GGDEF domain-containing protein [Clostridiales bacterium]|nr:GGDEF domain-containing protein [Clostridiales bacterium]
MDTKTLMLANMVGNITVVVFMLAYNRNHLNKVNREHFISQIMFAMAFIFFGAGYFWYSFDALSTILGNIGMIYGSAYIMISMIRFCDHMTASLYKKIIISSSILAVFATTFRIIPDFSNLRIGIVTLTIAVYLTVSSVYLLKNEKKSHLQSVIAYSFLLVALTHYYRTWEAFDFSRLYTIETPHIGHSLVMIGMYIYLIISGSGVVLISKEASDEKLYNAATYDGLTGCLNRQSIVSMAQEIIDNNQSSDQVIALVMVDIDHFKLLNDDYGHDVGDEMLIRFTKTIKDNLKPEDLLGRYGGDEFILLMQDETCDLIQSRCEAIRHAIEISGYESIYYTATFGVACLTSDIKFDFDHFAKVADHALYKAKAKSRNAVYVQAVEA